MKNSDRIPVDPVVLPLKAGELVSTLQIGVFGALLDATPEGWGRKVIDLQSGATSTPLQYALRSQGDRVGNLDLTAGNQPRTDPTLPGLSDLAAAVALLAELDKDVAPALFGNILPNTALGGARPKLTIAHAGHQWIGKFPSREDPVGAPMARVECAMLSLARACGIEAVDSTVVTVDDQDILLVKRFDRTAARSVGGHEGGWFRDAYLSARTLFHAKPDLQTYSFAGSYPRLATELGTWSAWSAADRAQLFRRMVFNCLTSNTDDHDRNHGVVTDDVTGGYRLAPAFDLVPRVHRTARREQAMDVGEEGAVGSLENVLSACRAFGLTRGAAAVIADETASSVRRLWRERFAANGLSEEVMERYAGCFGAWSAERPADALALGYSDGRVPPIG